MAPPRKHKGGPKGASAWFCRYVRRCREDNVFWELSFDEFCLLITGACVYCLRAPYRPAPRHMSSFNGLDRLNPKQGYSRENVVTACFECNGLKSNRFSPEETKIMARALARFRASLA